MRSYRLRAIRRSGRCGRAGESAPSATPPLASLHAIVWCGDAPVLQSPGDRRERHKREPHLGPGAHVGQPAQTPHQKRAMRLATSPRSAWAHDGPGRSRRALFASRNATNATIWPLFLLAISSKVGCTKKNVPLGVRGLNQRDEAEPAFLSSQSSVAVSYRASAGGVG